MDAPQQSVEAADNEPVDRKSLLPSSLRQRKRTPPQGVMMQAGSPRQPRLRNPRRNP